jgi:acyl phosphate:glycerol-3-phosphate acyltransferase
LLGLATVELLVAVGIFTLVFMISRYVSLGSIIASASFPLTMFVRHNICHAELQGYNTLIFFSIAMAFFLIYNHRTNIKRLIAGTEHRITNYYFSKRHQFKKDKTVS